jgi:hypothetical protein
LNFLTFKNFNILLSTWSEEEEKDIEAATKLKLGSLVQVEMAAPWS